MGELLSLRFIAYCLLFSRNLSAGRQFMQVEDDTREPVLTSRMDDPNERLLIEAAQKDPSRFAELYEL